MNPFSMIEKHADMKHTPPGTSTLAVAIFLMLLVNGVSAQLPSDTIKAGALNASLLERLIRDGVDSVRKSKGLHPLTHDSSLYLAALDQAAYLQSQRTISHRQPDEHKATVQKRAEYYGGRDYLCGENIAASWIDQLITEKEGKPYRNFTYKQMADDFVRLWAKSSGHHDNMIHPLYRYTGVAVTINPKSKRIVAVQVFGSPRHKG
jgi:uncharacterized protein YkwD